MPLIIRDKDFYKQLLKISVPIMLQNLISVGLNMMDTVMLGSLGEKQISASAIANQPFFIFVVFLFGIASGAGVLTAQYWGKKDKEAINRILMIALKVAVFCSLVFGIIVFVCPEAVMGLYTTDREVIALGAKFLRISGISYVFSAVSSTYLYILRSIEKVLLPLFINFFSFIINTVLNWVLIFGKLGLPAMGIRGSATATLIARIFELVCAIIYAFAFDKIIHIDLRGLLSFDRPLLRDFMRYSLPVVVNETFWAIGISMQSVVIGHISSQAVAANSIAGVLQRLATVIIMGVASFTAIAVGKQAGMNNFQEARAVARTMLVISVAVGLCSSAMILLLSRPFTSIYNVSGITKGYTLQIMAVYAVVIIFSSFNTTNIIGVLRGGGDTGFAMKLDILSLWFVALPLGAAASIWLKLPLAVIFLLLTCDEAVKTIVGIVRYKSGRWLQNVTR